MQVCLALHSLLRTPFLVSFLIQFLIPVLTPVLTPVLIPVQIPVVVPVLIPVQIPVPITVLIPVQIPVPVFDIDANGILNVSAKDKATGKEQSIVIQSSGGLSDADIQNMVKNAESFAAADKERREMIEAKNDADSLLYSTEKSFSEHRDKLTADQSAEVDKAIAELRECLEKEPPVLGDIKSKTEALSKASMTIGQAMYKASQEANAAKDAEEVKTESKAEHGKTESESTKNDEKARGA